MANTNANPVVGNDDYASKLNALVNTAWNEWLQNMSKDDLLTYLKDQPNVTADHLRAMLAQLNCKLSFGITFDVGSGSTHTDFYNGK